MNADDPHCNGGSRWSYQVIASVLSLCFKWNNPSRSHAHFPLQNKIQPRSIIKNTRHVEVCFQCWFGKTPKKIRGILAWLHDCESQNCSTCFSTATSDIFANFSELHLHFTFRAQLTTTIVILEYAGPTTLYFVRLFSWFIMTFRTF